jgi:hypothetical protein
MTGAMPLPDIFIADLAFLGLDARTGRSLREA